MPEYSCLLQIQELDIQIDQLEHRLLNLPEQEEVNSITDEISSFEAEFKVAGDELDLLRRKQKQLEDEVGSIEETIETYTAKIKQNQGGSSRELGDLASAIETREEQKRKLEDEILEQMERIEERAPRVEEFSKRRKELQLAQQSLTEKIQFLMEKIEVELDGIKLKRATLAQKIPENIDTIYERLRAHHNGIGAVRLEGNKCVGCDINMTHPSGEIEALRNLPADQVPQCLECQRILIIQDE